MNFNSLPDLTDPGALRRPIELSTEAFERHCRTSVVLERRPDGVPRVLGHDDASGQSLVTKIWWRDGVLGQRSWRYSDRFRRVLPTLAERGVAVPVYRAHGRVSGSGARFVIYEQMEGRILRELGNAIDLPALAEFVVALHARGIYFRGLHLGNIVYRDDGQFGLIDVQDVRLRNGPLGPRLRERNLGILCSHPHDRNYMLNGHWSELVMAYCRRAGMSVAQAAHMRELVAGQMERRKARREARIARREGSVHSA